MLKLDIDLDGLMLIAIITLATVLMSLCCCDVLYFVKYIFLSIYGSSFMDPIKISDDSDSYGICTLNDLDFVLKHMNNARFLREMDFARILFYMRSGAHKVIQSLGGDVVQSATSIRYRRTVPFLSTYKITTKLIHWDENAFYLEHEFITLKDGFVCAVVLSQQRLIKVTPKEILQKLLKDEVPEPLLPPEDLICWIDSMKHSSDKLRKRD